MMITRDYKVTDPEFAQLFEHFAFDEVVSEKSAKRPIARICRMQ